MQIVTMLLVSVVVCRLSFSQDCTDIHLTDDASSAGTELDHVRSGGISMDTPVAGNLALHRDDGTVLRKRALSSGSNDSLVPAALAKRRVIYHGKAKAVIVSDDNDDGEGDNLPALDDRSDDGGSDEEELTTYRRTREEAARTRKVSGSQKADLLMFYIISHRHAMHVGAHVVRTSTLLTFAPFSHQKHAWLGKRK